MIRGLFAKSHININIKDLRILLYDFLNIVFHPIIVLRLPGYTVSPSTDYQIWPTQTWGVSCSYHGLTELWATVLWSPEGSPSHNNQSLLFIRLSVKPSVPLRQWSILWRHPETLIKGTAPVLVIELIIISVLILSRPRVQISNAVLGGQSVTSQSSITFWHLQSPACWSLSIDNSNVRTTAAVILTMVNIMLTMSSIELRNIATLKYQ